MNTKEKLICLPNFKLKDEDVTPMAWLTYLFLTVRAGKDKEIQISREEIGEHLGISKRAVSRYGKQLEGKGLIEREITGAASIYRIKKDETKIKYLDK